MAGNRYILKPHFLGIVGDLIIRGFFLGVTYMIFNFVNGFREGIYERYDVDFLSSFTLDIEIMDLAILLLIYIVSVILIYFLIRFFIKFFAVWYQLGGKAILDYDQGKIIATKMKFPFNRVSIESKWHDIIEVEIEQTIFDQAFDTGTVTIEYLVLSDVDSQMKDIQLKNLKNPEKIKKRLLG